MTHERKTHDKILAAMAFNLRPMTVLELADHLCIGHRRVQAVLLELLSSGEVTRECEAGVRISHDAGRPAFLWSAKHARSLPPDILALIRRFPAGTIVVTPTNRTARVEKILPDGRARLKYMDGDLDGPDIKASLLHEFQAGRMRPDPVRVRG